MNNSFSRVIRNWEFFHFIPQNHASAVEKCEELQESNMEMQEKIQQFAETNKQYGIQKQQLEAAQRKIAALEEEILTFSEWKKLYKVRSTPVPYHWNSLIV